METKSLIGAENKVNAESPLFDKAFNHIEENNMKIQSLVTSAYNASLRLAPMRPSEKVMPLKQTPVENTNTLAERVEHVINFQNSLLEKLEELADHLNRNI